MNVWVDIENPPQVQYLSPFKDAFERRGDQVVVTARDASITIDLLRQRGIDPLVVDSPTKASRPAKVLALSRRAWRLRRRLSAHSPEVTIATSRSATIASWSMRVPCFCFCDYELVDLRAARTTGAYVVHPDVIDPEWFLAAGFRPTHLIPFRGIKEAISFAGMDLDHVEPYPLPAHDPSLVRVLFRPPGEATHYFASESLRLSLNLLRHLARRNDAIVVYAPRSPEQVSYLAELNWVNTPVVLERGVPFVRLLASVDAVVSAGGTMLREAAYLGIPAFSLFRSEIGQVDRYLQSIGRLRLVEEDVDFGLIGTHHATFDPMETRSEGIVDELAEQIAGRARRRSRT